MENMLVLLLELLWALAAVFGELPTTCVVASMTGLPCMYEGHLITDRNWYGYLANVTIMATGRLTFEFTYPADKCCQNVLFYSEDQMSIISARMNCWQKEYLLRPEDDQILRLTPRFSWSGCHMTHPNGIPTYVCHGGRSFTSSGGNMGDKAETWYIAVSNCATLEGLDLKYKLDIYGHVGECKSGYKILTTTPPMAPSPRVGELVPKEDMDAVVSDDACLIQGTLNISAKDWHGFLVNISLSKGGGFRFRFTYPYAMQVQNVILYNQIDVQKLKGEMNCWQKEGIIRSRHVPDQILDLSFRSSWNGCTSRNTSQGRSLTCQGERRYDTDRKLFVAVSNCRSERGLFLKYRFEVTGFEGNLCSGSRRIHHGGSTIIIFICSLAVILGMQTTIPRDYILGQSLTFIYQSLQLVYRWWRYTHLLSIGQCYMITRSMLYFSMYNNNNMRSRNQRCNSWRVHVSPAPIRVIPALLVVINTSREVGCFVVVCDYYLCQIPINTRKNDISHGHSVSCVLIIRHWQARTDSRNTAADNFGLLYNIDGFSSPRWCHPIRSAFPSNDNRNWHE